VHVTRSNGCWRVRAIGSDYRRHVQTPWTRANTPGHRRHPRTAVAALVAALAIALVGTLLSACAPADDAPPHMPSGVATAPRPAAPSPEPPSPTPPAHDAATIRAGTALTSGTLTLGAQAERPVVTAQPDGSVGLTVTVPAGTQTPATVAWLAPPEGDTFDVRSDQSVVVRDAAGGFVGALAVPTVTTTGRQYLRTTVQDGQPSTVRLTVTSTTGRALDGDTTVTVQLATVMLTSATWGEREGGRSLAVDPTRWARSGGLAAQEGIWAAVVAAAPDADTPGMRAQMLCHAVGAPDKVTWNLEPWRPDVDGVTMLMTRCNPT